MLSTRVSSSFDLLSKGKGKRRARDETDGRTPGRSDQTSHSMMTGDCQRGGKSPIGRRREEGRVRG